jgi:hypothetical protein
MSGYVCPYQSWIQFSLVYIKLFYFHCVGSYKLIETLSDPFLEPTSTKQWNVKFLAYVLPTYEKTFYPQFATK